MIRNRYNYLTPSVPRLQRETRAHLKQRHHNKNTTSRKPKGQFLSQTTIKNKNFSRTYMQRQTMTEIVNHSRNTAPERSVKLLLGLDGGMGWGGGGGLKSILRGHNLHCLQFVSKTRNVGFLRLYLSSNLHKKTI